METRREIITALAVAAALPAASLRATPARAGAGEAPYLPDCLVQDHGGRTFRFYEDLVKNKVVVFNMMYTACSRICPPNTAALLEIQRLLGKRVGRDIFMYSITLQPEIDSAAALHDYAKRYVIGPGWLFLRTGRKDLDTVRRKLGFYNSDPIADADISKHTGMIRVGNAYRDRWFMSPATAPAQQVVTSILNVI